MKVLNFVKIPPAGDRKSLKRDLVGNKCTSQTLPYKIVVCSDYFEEDCFDLYSPLVHIVVVNGCTRKSTTDHS